MILGPRIGTGTKSTVMATCPNPECNITKEMNYHRVKKREGADLFCAKCTVTIRNKSSDMRQREWERIDNVVSKLNSKENGLYIIKFTDRRQRCLVKCKHCSSEYEIEYKPEIYERYGCESCSRSSKLGSIIKGRSVSHKHRLHRIFNNMKARTGEHTIASSKENYEHIFICQEWLDDVESFYSWALANGYDDSLSIDRRENDKGYSPDNCRWTTKDVQSQNTRRIKQGNTSGYRGVSLTKSTNSYRARISVSNNEINIGTFATAMEAAYAYDNYVLTNNLEHTRNFT